MFTSNFLSFNERFFSDASSEDNGVQPSQGDSEGRHRLSDVVAEHQDCQLGQGVASQELLLQVSRIGSNDRRKSTRTTLYKTCFVFRNNEFNHPTDHRH